MSSSHLIVVSVQDYLRLLNSQVGTGFSFTESIMGFSTNESEVATNLYSALIQFFTVYSDYQKNDFYLTGEVGGWAEVSSIMWVVNGTATFPPIPTLPHPHSHTPTPTHHHTHTPTHPHTHTPPHPHTHTHTTPHTYVLILQMRLYIHIMHNTHSMYSWHTTHIVHHTYIHTHTILNAYSYIICIHVLIYAHTHAHSCIQHELTTLTCTPLQSYAGKYVPAIGYKIHMENMQQPKIYINLRGIAIGDGLCDPVNVSLPLNRSSSNSPYAIFFEVALKIQKQCFFSAERWFILILD